MLKVCLLGAVSIARDGVEVERPALRKAVALLAYLTMHGPTSREVLADRLWPDGQREAARQSLRTALASLRRALGEDALRADRLTIELAEPVETDVAALERALERGGEAVALAYTGSFLDGFYEPWPIEVAASLEARVADALVRWDREAGSEESFQTLVRADRTLRGHPDLARQLVRRYLERGDPGSARGTVHRLEASMGEVDREARALVRSATELRFRATFGRSRELADLAELSEVHRWITLVAPGGFGKTHLAQELVRRELSAEFRSVRDLESGDDLPSLLGATGWSDLAARTLPSLLVLDEAEDLPGLALAVERLLRARPDVRVMVTSRQALGGIEEMVYPIGPLEMPDHDSPTNSPAVQMFQSLVRQPMDERLVGRLCRRVGGHPLAITLMARAARTEPLESILEHLGARLEPVQTALDWSIRRLSEAGRRGLDLYAALDGPMFRSTLQELGADPQDLLDGGLASVTQFEAEPMLECHSMALKMAQARLEPGTVALILASVGRHYSAIAHRYAESPWSGDAIRLISTLAAEHRALETCLRHMAAVDLPGFTELVRTLGEAWGEIVRGRTMEWLFRASSDPSDGPIWRVGGYAAVRRREFGLAAERFTRAADGAEGLERARALVNLAQAQADSGDHGTAEATFELGLADLVGTEDEGWALTLGSRIAWMAEEDDRARERGLIAIEKLRAQDAPRLLGRALHELATIYFYREEYDEALRLMRESASVKRRAKAWTTLPASLEGEAMALMGLGRTEEAHGPLLEAMTRLESLGAEGEFDQTLMRAAEWAWLAGQRGAASRFLGAFEERCRVGQVQHHRRKQARIERLRAEVSPVAPLPSETDREWVSLLAQLRH